MKCPKCGSELDTGFNCPKCGRKRNEEMITEYNTNFEKIYEKNTIKLVQPEPTTAEMLLWLVENFNVNIRDDCGLEVYIEHRKNGRWIDYFVGDGYECKTKTLSEAIKQAYEWARKEVRRYECESKEDTNGTRWPNSR